MKINRTTKRKIQIKRNGGQFSNGKSKIKIHCVRSSGQTTTENQNKSVGHVPKKTQHQFHSMGCYQVDLLLACFTVKEHFIKNVRMCSIASWLTDRLCAICVIGSQIASIACTNAMNTFEQLYSVVGVY